MAGTDPWTGARLGDDNDSPLGGTFIARAVTDLRLSTCPRFATVSARDAAVAALQAAGVAISNGMTCWTDDVGFWERIGGAWVQRTSPARLRLTATDDASETSTLHAFQIGPTSGSNLIIDNNEIISRNNGALGYLGVGGCQIANVGAPTGSDQATNKGYVDGPSGVLPLIGGWAPYGGYHAPYWYLSPSGQVTLSGVVQRTAASFVLGTGTGFQFATLPSALVPAAKISPTSAAVGLANGGVFPARIFCDAGSTSLQVMGMDSGSGTMPQNQGCIFLDGVTFHV